MHIAKCAKCALHIAKCAHPLPQNFSKSSWLSYDPLLWSKGDKRIFRDIKVFIETQIQMKIETQKYL